MELRSLFKPSPIKAYWWREVQNFGDALAPLLLERFADIEVQWDTISHSSVASVGSILEHIPPLWGGYILGSGRLFENSRIHTKGCKILLLRGPLSAKGVPGIHKYGDPGLLADELVGPQEKQWDLGIVPHWLDKELVERFLKLIPSRFTVKTINPRENPLAVLRQIGACRRIVTSSLHGMVCADAFGIPRRVETFDRLLREGGVFKFRDYSMSLGMSFLPGVMMKAPIQRVENLKFNVYDAYQALSEALKC
jgi:pyruvyltransferase